jgi:hypothetical protein
MAAGRIRGVAVTITKRHFRHTRKLCNFLQKLSSPLENIYNIVAKTREKKKKKKEKERKERKHGTNPACQSACVEAPRPMVCLWPILSVGRNY